LLHGLAKKTASAVPPDSLCAVPVVAGQAIADWGDLTGAVIKADGTFKIEVPKTIKVMSGGALVDTPADWMLLLLNSKAATRYDEVVGFLALNEIGQSLISFPISKIKTDSIELGNVSQNGDEAQADSSRGSDTATFNLTIAQLGELARTGKTLKMIKNSFGNYDPSTKTGLDIRATYSLGNMPLSVARNREMVPSDYLDTGKYNYGIQVFPAKGSEFDYNAIVSRAVSYDLYPPELTYVENFVDGRTFTAPLSSFFSTDSSLNPMIGNDTNGGTCRVLAYALYEQGAVSSLLYGGFKGISPSGTWRFKENRAVLLAQFDLGVGTPVDSVTGKPVVYVPSVNVAVNAADTTVGSITVSWYYWNPTSNVYIRSTDPDLIRNNISSIDVSISTVTAPGLPATAGEHFQFGTPLYGQAFSQPVPAEIVAVPTKKWFYGTPGTSIKFTISVSYTCFFQTFEVRVEEIAGRG